MRWVIDKLWDGGAARSDERATIEAAWDADTDTLRVTVDAPWHGDPAPPASVPRAPGQAEGLWNHEVVELFLAGAGGHYLELEFGPYGHTLALAFAAPRQRTPLGPAPISVAVSRVVLPCRWQAIVHVPAIMLPPAPHAANACAIHGPASARRYLSATPLPGPRPDFHQPARFAACELGPRRTPDYGDPLKS